MAVTRSGNVYRVTSPSGTISNPVSIAAVKYIGATAGTADIKGNASGSGQILWEESGTANVFNRVKIRDNVGLEVTVSANVVLYLYNDIR